MPLQFIYRRKVKDNRIQVANITYKLGETVPDGTPVQAVFAGCQQDGRKVGYCGVYMDSRSRNSTWPYGAARRIEAVGEFDSH